MGSAHAESPTSEAKQDAASQATSTIEFNIAEQALDRAVVAFAEQAGVQVFFDSGKLAGLRSPGLHGRHSVADGLALLLAGTPVGYQFTGERKVSLERLAETGGALELGATQIQAGHVDDWVYEAPRSVSVISREQIDRRPPRHAADMLADTPGVTSAVDRNNPGLSVNIRGMQDFGRVNMMIDGMRQNHVESGHQQRNGEMYIDSELLSSVVIEKGPNAGVYGANAIAGSANFQTLDYDDIILPGKDQGVRLRGTTGIGGYANGVNFLGSTAVAGRFDDRLELLLARSQKNIGEYAIGQRGKPNQMYAWSLDSVSEVAYSDQLQDSWLGKIRLRLDDDQSLQFTYTGTDISYNNTSSFNSSNQNGYKKYGSAAADANNYALDYVFTPDNPLIDLKAKLYFVTTENERITEGSDSSSVLTEPYWRLGTCLGNNLSDIVRNACLAGMRNTTTSRTDTWGLQLDNTSRFTLALLPNTELVANYGIEWFQDQGKSNNAVDRNGVTTAYLSEAAGNRLNPNGRRDVASAFTSLEFIRDPFTLKMGLRYDWYHLRGKTTVPGNKSAYLSRLQSFTNYFCGLNQAVVRNATGCTIGKSGDEAAAAAFYQSISASYNYYTTTRFKPEWSDEHYRYEYDVDRSQGKLSPFLSAAYRPLDWLELFANWGKGFRPPAMTETLWEGAHVGGSSSYMYPNPYLEAERTTSWEAGFNIISSDLLRGGDSLRAKLAYFSTKADNYMVSTMANNLPGTMAGLSLGNTMFNNNLLENRFKGVELEADYDAQLWYAGVNYTKYLNDENDFCQKTYPLGSQSSKYDQPNEDGSMTSQHLQAIAEGYKSYQDMMDRKTSCGLAGVLNSVVFVPQDKHGANFGVRLFEKALDVGVRYSRSKGNTPSYAKYDYWDAYTTWDLYARYQPLETLALNLAVENVRDKAYLSANSDYLSRTYAPGRTVQAGVEIRF